MSMQSMLTSHENGHLFSPVLILHHSYHGYGVPTGGRQTKFKHRFQLCMLREVSQHRVLVSSQNSSVDGFSRGRWDPELSRDHGSG